MLTTAAGRLHPGDGDTAPRAHPGAGLRLIEPRSRRRSRVCRDPGERDARSDAVASRDDRSGLHRRASRRPMSGADLHRRLPIRRQISSTCRRPHRRRRRVRRRAPSVCSPASARCPDRGWPSSSFVFGARRINRTPFPTDIAPIATFGFPRRPGRSATLDHPRLGGCSPPVQGVATAVPSLLGPAIRVSSLPAPEDQRFFFLLAPVVYAFAGHRVWASVSDIGALSPDHRSSAPARATGAERRLRLPAGLQHFSARQ